jgi:hypothetical protein
MLDRKVKNEPMLCISPEDREYYSFADEGEL